MILVEPVSNTAVECTSAQHALSAPGYKTGQVSCWHLTNNGGLGRRGGEVKVDDVSGTS